MSSSTRNIIIKVLGIVLGAAVIGAALGAVAATLRPQTYTATTVVMVTPAKDLEGAQNESVSQYILSNMPTFNNLATTASVLGEATGHGKSQEEISSSFKVEVPTGSTLVRLAYTDTDEARATAISDDLTNGLRDAIRTFAPQANGTSELDVAIVQSAGSATTDNKPSASTWAFVGGLAGAVLGAALARAGSKRRAATRARAFHAHDLDQEPRVGSSAL